MDPAAVWVWASGDEGRTWEKLSEVDNPAIQPAPLVDCPERYADTLCRLPDDTLLLPVESRFGWMLDPAYVHRSTDGGKTWSAPAAISEPPRPGLVLPRTGPGFLGTNSYETMIARMASGKLLAVIRYHGSVIPPWPLIDPGQHPNLQDYLSGGLGRQGRDVEELASADERARPVPRLRRRPQRRLSGCDARSSISARDTRKQGHDQP